MLTLRDLAILELGEGTLNRGCDYTWREWIFIPSVLSILSTEVTSCCDGRDVP